MEPEWLEAVEALDRLNRLLDSAGCHQLPQLLEERARAVAHIHTLAESGLPASEPVLQRLKAALAPGVAVRNRLALERGNIRVQLEQASRAAILLGRLQAPTHGRSLIDCEG